MAFASTRPLVAEAAVDESLELLLSPELLQERVRQVAKEIDAEYAGKEITLLMVMKGALCVASDLMREIRVPVNLEYIRASSYGANGKTAGKLRVFGLEKIDIEGKDILIVDDIFDTGNTMSTIFRCVMERSPKSVKTLVLLRKKMERKTTLIPDYTLFDIDNLFVVGYGLDYKERYRSLPGVYVVK